nr:HD domain-containing protein [Lapidilactobacillus bayanensis]
MKQDHSGHDVAHIQRVVNLARYLLKAHPEADQEIVLVAAATHDILDDKLVTDVAAKREELLTIYRAAGLTEEQVAAILAIIDHMSYSKNLQQHYQLSIDGQLVQDADRLDALGAIGIGRTFYYGAHTGAPMYDPTIAPRTNLTKQDYRQKSPVLNHFYEKLFKLGDLMNTAEAKDLAAQRIQFMHEFVDTFKHEWEFDE